MTKTDNFKKLRDIFRSNPIMPTAVFFVSLLVLATVVTYQRYVYVKEIEKSISNNILKSVESNIKQSINSALFSSISLALSVNDNGEPVGFNNLGEHLVDNNKFIDGIQLVPDGIIKYVYPYKRNISALNYNILEDPATRIEAQKAIKQKKFFIAGPLNLKQGGKAVVCRLPIFRKNKFWGFAASIISFETLIKNAGIDTSSNSEYYYQLSKVNPNTLIEENFLPIRSSKALTYITSVVFQESNWKISVAHLTKNKLLNGVILIGFFSLLAAVALSLLLYNILSKPALLEKLVLKRTLDLKNSEKQIRKSEEKYRTVLDRISEAFIAFDEKWNYTYINKLAGEILGLNPEQLIGKNIWEEFPDSNGQPFQIAYEKGMKEQQYQYLLEYYAPLEKWLEYHIYPSKQGLSVFLRDVTKQKNNEIELKRSQALMNSVFNSNIIGLIYWNANGEILDANQTFLETFGYTKNDLLNKKINWSEMTPPEYAVQDQLAINEVNLNGFCKPFEKEFYRKDGKRIPILIGASSLEDGVSGTGVAYVLDISYPKKVEIEMQELQENYFRIISSVDGIVWEADAQTFEFTFVSKKAEKMLGYPLEEWTKNPTFWADHIYIEDREWAVNYCKEHTNENNDHVFEYRMVSADGRIVWIRDIVTVQVESNKPKKLIGVITDITEAKKNEKTLESQNIELKKTNKELDRFVYSASHDLRAPLKSMLGLISIAKLGVDSENSSQMELLVMLNKSVLKLDSFIEDILDYSRNSRNSRMEIEKEVIVFEEMVQEMRLGLKFMEGAEELNLKVEIIQNEKFVSDLGRLNVILNNIISNAIKYKDISKEKSFVKLNINCNKEHAIIIIEDNGIGITDKDKDKVFEMFYRATKLSTGSGLGLYIVKEAIEKLNAEIELESEIRVGTKFTITIPNLLTTLN